ncbi:hypothetical protein [Hydrogenovibrio marinus]|uniref:Uncharacterized protein n=1 Tax=Hydrogenovibrio marinus TaxID=28885 RepID=A0A066ZW91_HYDMR|nr:hypothetical protein [Hydrogenovibrio marinus]KDN94611.1 hypothetical protein EI16_11955 [Hydrogenovibrio marinus]
MLNHNNQKTAFSKRMLKNGILALIAFLLSISFFALADFGGLDFLFVGVYAGLKEPMTLLSGFSLVVNLAMAVFFIEQFLSVKRKRIDL